MRTFDSTTNLIYMLRALHRVVVASSFIDRHGGVNLWHCRAPMPSSRLVTAGALALYLVILIVAGVVTSRRTKSFRDYVTGGGAIPAWMLALSFMANFISSNSFIGHAAQSYQSGLVWCGVAVVIVVACAVSWHVFAPRFAAFGKENHAATLPDFFEKRFGSRPLAVLVQWLVVITTLLYVLAILRGTALVVASGLGLSYAASLVVIYSVTLVYCLLGGFWADVSTDVVQAFILFAGAIALFLAVLLAPALAPVPDGAPITPPPLRPAPIGLVLATGLAGGVKLLADPKQVMVFYAFRDEVSARRFRWLGPLILLIIYGCLFPIGYLARRLVPSAPDLDTLIPGLIFEQGLLGSWFGGLFLISLFAASMSSLDSSLLVMASCIEKHAVAPFFKREPSARSTRVLLAAVATVALALSFRPLGGIVALTTLSAALLGASLLPVLCVGFTKLNVTASRAALSISAGFVGAVAGKLAPALLGVRSPWVQDIFVGLLASSLVLAPSLLSGRGAAAGERGARG
jgi:solute:Na+ symporter, SSS family